MPSSKLSGAILEKDNYFMSTPSAPTRSLGCLKRALRSWRAQRQQVRNYANAPATEVKYPSLQMPYPPPSPGFRTSQTTKQNRIDDGLRKITVHPAPRSTAKACRDPIAKVTADQIAALDPTGARTRLFAPDNTDRVKPGDILLVRFKTGDPYSGVVLDIRQRHQPIDTAVLLRNELTRVGVEMWVKVYSPSVEGMEVVQRRAKRARRAKLTYMRQPRHDVGSVEGIVRTYIRQTERGPMGSGQVKGRDANANRKKQKGKGKGKKR